MNWICAICQELLTHHPEEPNRRPDPPEVDVTRCGHLFHRFCIDKWFENSNGLVRDCPLCKQSCLNAPLTKIYPVTSDDTPSFVAITRPQQGEGVTEAVRQVQSLRNEMVQCQGLMEGVGADIERYKRILQQQLNGSVPQSVQSLPGAGAIVSNTQNRCQLPNSSTRRMESFLDEMD